MVLVGLREGYSCNSQEYPSLKPASTISKDIPRNIPWGIPPLARALRKAPVPKFVSVRVSMYSLQDSFLLSTVVCKAGTFEWARPGIMKKKTWGVNGSMKGGLKLCTRTEKILHQINIGAFFSGVYRQNY